MRKFDYSFLSEGMLPASLLNVACSIAELKTMAGVRKAKYSRIFTELESVAIIQSVRDSNKIEGIETTADRITAIVTQNSAPLNHDEAEIAGYRDALSAVHTGYKYLDFRQRDIMGLHNTMLTIVGDKEAGKYKSEDNIITEYAPDGSRRVRFVPVSAEETPKTMEQLELAFLEARGNLNVNQLLLIPCVILDFLCIHPFIDGNGRVSRLLSLLLLYKNGYDVGKYISFESQINKYKVQYYEALRQSSVGWAEGKNNYFPFIQNFISILYMCYKELDKRFSMANGKHVTKKSMVEATVLNSLLPISKAEICSVLPNVSVNTVEKVLGDMVKRGVIVRTGSSRDSKYIKA